MTSLLKTLKHLGELNISTSSRDIAAVTFDSMELLKEQSARIAELEANQPWISVGDRLPEDRSDVLCLNRDGKVFKCMRQGRGFKVDCTVWECSYVTHWMPLPKPLKQAEGG